MFPARHSPRPTRDSITTGSSGGRLKDRSGTVHPGKAAMTVTSVEAFQAAIRVVDPEAQREPSWAG
jgi:hypothetical protein